MGRRDNSNGQKEGWSSDRNLLLKNNHRSKKDNYPLIDICIVISKFGILYRKSRFMNARMRYKGRQI